MSALAKSNLNMWSRSIKHMSNYYLGIDIGGTFTDVVMFDPDNLILNIRKVPSTPEQPEMAVINAINSMDIDKHSIKMINHASTVATNSLLTKTGLAKSALITNKGFRDILEIGRQRRSEIYNLNFERPMPLIPRKYRFTIHGRVLSDGTVSEPIDDNEIGTLRKKLEDLGIEGLAISLLNSYINDSQERQVKRHFEGFKGYVFASHEIDMQYREYERTSTTVVNTVLSKLVSGYLGRLQNSLELNDILAPVYMMGSNGGLNTLSYAERVPISVIESGPSAGVLASAYYSNMLGENKIITFDMGGTTAKAGVVIDGNPDISYEFEAAGKTHSGRSIKGSGYAVRFPFVDLAEVSAGGGTIAWVDEGNSLRVGPLSAGSIPGPAAYGIGGERPTVTDANIILGRLNPDFLLGGKMKIYADLSIGAIKTKIADILNISTTEAAGGIIKLINNSMAKAISIVSVERGRDPRDFILYSFGGAGPLHACDLAEELEIRDIFVPEHPGLFSAYGLLSVDMLRNYTVPVTGQEDLEAKFREIEDNVKKQLENEGFNSVEILKYIDMRYAGQSYEITIEHGKRDAVEFKLEYKRRYGYSSDDPIEIVNARVTGKVKMPKIRIAKHEATNIKPLKNVRKVWFNGAFIDTPVYTWNTIPPDYSDKGPAVIEGYDSTAVVNPGWRWSTDEYLNLRMVRE